MSGVVSGEAREVIEEREAHELTEARGLSVAVTFVIGVCLGSESERGITSRERSLMRGRSKVNLWVRMRSRRSARSC